jgi:hypothetical protein
VQLRGVEVKPLGPKLLIILGVISRLAFFWLWVHPLQGFEPMSSGPTALVNRPRRPNGTGDAAGLLPFAVLGSLRETSPRSALRKLRGL